MAEVQYNWELRPTSGQIQRRFNHAENEMVEAKRDEIRHLGRRFKELAQEEAPEDTGDFKETIFFRTYVSGNVVGFTAGGRKPLSDWIRFGTRPHTIMGRPLLAFYWEAVGERVVVHSVQHPGTKPNDYIARAHERFQPEARAAVRRMGLAYQRGLS